MPNPTLESLLLQRAQHIGPDPMAGPLQDYPGAKIGMMQMPGTPGKLSGLLNGITPTEEESSPIINHIAGWLGIHNPNMLSAVEETLRQGEAMAAGHAVNGVKKGLHAWKDYTGHNLVPTPHGIFNTIFGTNYGNDK